MAVQKKAVPDQGTREKILAAAVRWAAETGLRKLSMDEIARAAGVSRGTVYLHFPNRDALFDAAAQQQLTEFFAGVMEVAARYRDPHERLVRTFAYAYDVLSHHALVQSVLRVNPALLIPYVIGNRTAIDFSREIVVGIIAADEIQAPITPEELAEQIVRAFHSLILAPSTVFNLDQPGGAEDYARRFLLPLVTQPR